MDYTDTIRRRLVAHYRTDLNIYCRQIPAERWLTLPCSPQYRFGWMPPFDLRRAGVADNLIAFVAPEMIAAVTAHLSSADLSTYLTVIEAVADIHVAAQGEPPAVIDARIEELLYREAPHALRLRFETEAHAMDAGLVPVRR